jgi:subtilisin family serine protease
VGDADGSVVAASAAAATNNGIGIAGIAPGARIMPVKVMPNAGPGDFADVNIGLDWAVAHGADVVNISLSAASLGSYVAFFQQSFTAARAAGVVVIASSGNEGTLHTNYPCGFTYVLCVGSTNKGGTAVSSFSTRSERVVVVAPGEQIWSTVPGAAYESWFGTSMAAPHVAGVAALMRSAAPALPPVEIGSLLAITAVDLGPAGFDTGAGFGRVDAAAAVGAAATIAGGGSGPTPTPPTGTRPAPQVGLIELPPVGQHAATSASGVASPAPAPSAPPATAAAGTAPTPTRSPAAPTRVSSPPAGRDGMARAIGAVHAALARPPSATAAR